MKDDVLRKLAIPFVLVAGTCWAGMIILIRMLSAYGLGAMDKVLVRCVMSSIILFFLMLFTNRGMLKVKIKDLWIFIISAIITVLLFNYSYFRAADGTMMSAALAVVLLYISPAFVMILSRLILKEKITSAKLIARVLIIIGTILVTGIASGKPQVTAMGLLFGIGAAVFYAMITTTQSAKLPCRRCTAFCSAFSISCPQFFQQSSIRCTTTSLSVSEANTYPFPSSSRFSSM